jgi:hypothetical protein
MDSIRNNKKYLQKLIGYDIVDEAPLLYWEVRACQELGRDFYKWRRQTPTHVRGLEIAATQIKNMIALLERHEELQAEQRKELEDKAKKTGSIPIDGAPKIDGLLSQYGNQGN